MMEVRTGGRGTDADAALVRAELAKLPAAELAMLHSEGIGAIVCWDSVVDHRPDLANDVPRNWSKDTNWSMVPGCYAPDERNIIIATVPGAGGGRVVPPKGVKHGSWNLVLHETMHADDYAAGQRRCRNHAFVIARNTELARVPIPLSKYERRSDQAGHEETYAETAARYYGADPGMAAGLPTLHAFWAAAALPLTPGPALRGRRNRKTQPLGTATILDNGDIELDVRAENDAGIIGHALIRLGSEDPEYDRFASSFRGSGRRGSQERTVVINSF